MVNGSDPVQIQHQDVQIHSDLTSRTVSVSFFLALLFDGREADRKHGAETCSKGPRTQTRDAVVMLHVLKLFSYQIVIYLTLEHTCHIYVNS